MPDIHHLNHMKKLARAMEPDPKDWVYRNEIFVDEDGNAHCECGHNIVYIFPIYNKTDARALSIGSVCIEASIPYLMENGNEGLASDLKGALAKLVEMLKAKQKEIREKKNQERLNIAWGNAQKLIGWYDNIVSIAKQKMKDKSPRYIDYRGNPVYQCFYLPKYFYNKKQDGLRTIPDLDTTGRKAGSLNRRMKTFIKNVPQLKHKFDIYKISDAWVDPPEIKFEEKKEKVNKALVEEIGRLIGTDDEN